MTKRLPRSISRYRPIGTKYMEDEIEQAVKHSNFYVKPLAVMNDPFEGNPRFVINSIKEIRGFLANFYQYDEYIGKLPTGRDLSDDAINKKQRKLARELTTNTIKAARLEIETSKKIFSDHPETTYACSFSEDPLSILMWSHYSGDHTGYCFVLDKTETKFQENGPLFGDVEYLEERSLVSVLDVMNMVSWAVLKDPRIADELIGDQVSRAMALEKSQEWGYEKEWRLIDFGQTEPHYQELPYYKVVAILCGIRMPTEIFSQIESQCRGLCKVVRIQLDSDRYAFVVPDFIV